MSGNGEEINSERPISPFELSRGQNYLQTHLESIAKRLGENEDIVSSISALLAEERQRYQHGRQATNRVVLGDESTFEDEKGTKRKLFDESRGNVRKSSQKKHSPKTQPALEQPGRCVRNRQMQPAVTVSREPSREAMRTLRDLSQRKQEIQGIRWELWSAKQRARTNLAEAQAYRQRSEEAEKQLASLNEECDTLRCDLVKSAHNSTDITIAVLVAELQASVKQIQSEVASLSDKAKNAEQKASTAAAENDTLRQQLNERDERCLHQGKQIDSGTKKTKDLQRDLKKLGKEQKSAARDADVWQQKYLSLAREFQRKEAMISQHQATVNGLQKRLQQANPSVKNKLAAEQQRTAELERELIACKNKMLEDAEVKQSTLDEARQRTAELEASMQERCPRTQSECRQERTSSEQNTKSLADQLEQLTSLQTEEQTSVAALHADLDETHREVDKLKEENQRLLAEKSQLCDEVNQTFEQMSTKHEQWQAEGAALQKQLADSEAHLEELKAENAELRDHSRNSPSISVDTERLKSELQAKSELQHLRQRATDLQCQLDKKAADHQTADVALRGMTVSNKDLRSALDLLKAESTWKTDQLEKLESTRKSLQEDLVQCKLHVQSLANDMQQAKSSVTIQARDDVARLTESMHQQDKRLLVAEAKSAALQKDLTDSQTSNTKEKRERLAVRESLNRQEEQCRSLRGQLAESQLQARRDRDEHLQHSRQLRQSLQSVKQKAEAADRKVQELSDQLCSSDKRLKQRTSHTTSLQEQLKTLRKTLSERDMTMQEQQTALGDRDVILGKLSQAEQDARKAEEELNSISRAHEDLKSSVKESVQRLRSQFQLPAEQDARHGDDVMPSLNSVISAVTRLSIDALRTLQHVQHAASTKKAEETCSSCTNRIPQLTARLQKAKQQSAEAKLMLQASRRMLQELALSFNQQEAAFKEKLLRVQRELGEQRVLAAALKQAASLAQ